MIFTSPEPPESHVQMRHPYVMENDNTDLRTRILSEAAAARAHTTPGSRPTWTKKARYGGQLTFDSKNGMQQLPFGKAQIPDPPAWRSPSSSQGDSSAATSGDGWTTTEDPIMRELNEMQRNASQSTDLRRTSASSSSVSEGGSQKRHDTSSTGHDKPNPEDLYQILRQPETRPITQEQLVNEVKGIYAGLVMVEKKCVEIDQQQIKTTNELSDEKWEAVIALHRSLLYEHHDFFLASQHPSASLALRRLATKYAMPSRMFQRGIATFLEILRDRFPISQEHMTSFLSTARSMITLFQEILPDAREQWLECERSLELYHQELEQVRCSNARILINLSSDGGFDGTTASSSPSDKAFIPNHYWPSSSTEYPSYDSCGSGGGAEDFGDWYFRCYPHSAAPSPVEDEQHYEKMPFKMPDGVMCLLCGWLEYGQALATDFNVYCKVFKLLLLSGMW